MSIGDCDVISLTCRKVTIATKLARPAGKELAYSVVATTDGTQQTFTGKILIACSDKVALTRPTLFSAGANMFAQGSGTKSFTITEATSDDSNCPVSYLPEKDTAEVSYCNTKSSSADCRKIEQATSSAGSTSWTVKYYAGSYATHLDTPNFSF